MGRTTTKRRHLNLHARDIAREAHDENFSSRRGLGEWADHGKPIGFYVYDNNPWAHDPKLRDRQYGALVAMLDARDCRVVACSSYPVRGDSAGYTIAYIFESASPERVGGDREAAREFIERCAAEVFRAAGVPVPAIAGNGGAVNSPGGVA